MKRIRLAVLLFVALFLAAPAHAYVDLAPTLTKVMRDSRRISLVEVTRVEPSQGIVLLKEVSAFKGTLGTDPIRQRLWPSGSSAMPGPVALWAAPGARAMAFIADRAMEICVGEGWYQVDAGAGGWWKLGVPRPDLPLAYYGTVARLANAVQTMLDGREAVITTEPYGSDSEGATFDLALNRPALPGLIRVRRVRASMNMSPNVIGTSSDPGYVIGEGPVDVSDLPKLIDALKSGDADTRAGAADDLRWLNGAARPAQTQLRGLLQDESPRVRFSCAAALLHINAADAEALKAVAAGLASHDAVTRRLSVKAAGLAGKGAASLAPALGECLKQEDTALKMAALQAISTLGPAAACDVDAVVALLNHPTLRVAAADALGRMGPAAHAAVARLATMLQSGSHEEQWAAVRGMAQIGGDDAHPAVEFLIKNLSGAPEAEQYNTMVYLSLLGPVANDAIPVIRATRIKNPVLPSSTIWAIEPTKSFPWQRSTAGPFGRGPGFGPGGGPGGGLGGGPGGGPDIARYIYTDTINELGPRLQPAAEVLTDEILAGAAGDVPDWGYKILLAGGEQTLNKLAAALKASTLVERERAAVAIGYIGTAASALEAQLTGAAASAADPREVKLMQWAARQVRGR